ncbi:MAG: Tfp pilus assembly protein FimT/FimU, partial [Candidatus Methylacidiphilales bacterium]
MTPLSNRFWMPVKAPGIKGFTLIELIAVISIVSVLAVATVQSIGPMRGNELSAASRVVSSLMAV